MIRRAFLKRLAAGAAVIAVPFKAAGKTAHPPRFDDLVPPDAGGEDFGFPCIRGELWRSDGCGGCGICHAETRWIDILAELWVCSPACYDKFWDGYAEACDRVVAALHELDELGF